MAAGERLGRAEQAALPEASSAQRKKAATRITARLPKKRVTARTRAVLRGRVMPRGRRPLELQQRTNSGWTKVAATRSRRNGTFRFRLPTWWAGTHRFRVLAPATAQVAARRSPRVALRVVPPRRARGNKNAYRLTRDGWRWDPCRPITYRFNPAGGYPGWERDLDRAFAEVTAASGLRFQKLGSTGLLALVGLPPPDADVIVSWGTPALVPQLLGAVGLGWSRGRWTGATTGEWFQGAIVLDRNAGLARGFGADRGASWGQVMMHEIGHVIGLQHTGARSQLMYAAMHSDNQWPGRGDLEGMRQLGRTQTCISPSARDEGSSTTSARVAPGTADHRFVERFQH